MVTINEWDWKFKIGIYENVNSEVKNKIDFYMTPSEKNIYNYLFSYHVDKVSLLYILDELINNKYSTWEETGMFPVEILCERLLPIHPVIQEYTFSKLQQAINNNRLFEKELVLLYDIAIKKYINSFEVKNIFQVILGDTYFNNIVKCIEKVNNINVRTKEEINKSILKEFALKTINDVSLNKNVIEKFGSSLVDNYDVDIKEGVGFAEWWDRQLINGEKDLLVLYNNKNLRNLDDFKCTIYHEVYPGHGQFYNFVRNNSSSIKLFDQGAVTLIEGWATYCEWFVNYNQYSLELINRAKKFLLISLSDDYNFNEKVNLIYNNCIKCGYSNEQALSTIISFTQYPTYLESYYLGAFCIREIINCNKIKPLDFLLKLKGKVCGELFSLW